LRRRSVTVFTSAPLLLERRRAAKITKKETNEKRRQDVEIERFFYVVISAQFTPLADVDHKTRRSIRQFTAGCCSIYAKKAFALRFRTPYWVPEPGRTRSPGIVSHIYLHAKRLRISGWRTAPGFGEFGSFDGRTAEPDRIDQF
jgi:hypothetical protein